MKTINRLSLSFILIFILKLNVIGQVQFVGDFESESPGSANGKCDRFNKNISFNNTSFNNINGVYDPSYICQECIVAQLSNEPSVNIISSNKRAGQYSALISVKNKNVENMARMELYDRQEMNFDKSNNEFWYKVSIFLPPGYTGGNSGAPNFTPYTWGDLYSEDGWVIHAQLWAIPDASEFPGKEPVFALITQGGNWKIWRRSSPIKLMANGGDGLVTENTDLLPYNNDIGKWTDWVFHFKWGWNNDGTTEVWKNGDKVYTGLNISNCYNDDYFPQFKAGIYTYFKNLGPNKTAPLNYTITVGIDEYMRSKTLAGLTSYKTSAPYDDLTIRKDIKGIGPVFTLQNAINTESCFPTIRFAGTDEKILTSNIEIKGTFENPSNPTKLSFNFNSDYNNIINKEVLTLNKNGNIGIGTTDPYASLHIRKDIANNIGPSLILENKQYGSPAENSGSLIRFQGYIWNQGQSNENIRGIDIRSYMQSNAAPEKLSFIFKDIKNSTEQMNYEFMAMRYLSPTTADNTPRAQVLIGQYPKIITLGLPRDALLGVNGKIYAKGLELRSDIWGDNVFYGDYRLLSLYKLDKYIKTNKHLPEIPSENEVLKNGYNVGEMNVILLKKIEELTLYVIDLQRQLDSLKKK